MRNLHLILMLALLAAPVALAQETNETASSVATEDKSRRNTTAAEDPARPNDAAWVDDCPPDMMCAADAGGEERPNQYGNDGCIDCSGPVDNGETCMDGAQQNETCSDDVQYLGGEPSRGPADGSCEYCRGDNVDAEPISAPAPTEQETASSATNAVPGAGLGLVVAAIGIGAVLVIRKL